MKKRGCISLVLAAGMLLSQMTPVLAAEGAPVHKEFYVATNGSDSADGSKDSPFATIKRAQEAVREVNDNMKGDVKVYLGDGVHYLDETLRFDEKDSGSNGYYVSYEAAPGAEATISGGTVVEGFKPVNDGSGLWKAPFDKAEYIVTMDVNGVPGRRAQSEEPGRLLRHWDDVENEVYQVDGFYTNADDLALDLRNKTDIQLHICYMWRDYLYNVDDVVVNPENKNEHLVKVSRQIGQEYAEITSQTKDPINWGYVIENCFEELDVPGEFYYDRVEKMLYYLPRENEDMTTAIVEVPVLEELVHLEGSSSRAKLSNISFSGITFEHVAWYDRSRYGFHTGQTQDFYAQPEMLDYPTIIGKYFVPAAVQLRMTDYISVTGCTFRGITQVAIGVYAGAYHTKIDGNKFYDLGDGAVTVGTGEAYESTPVEGYNLAEGKPAKDNGTPIVKQQRYMTQSTPAAAVDPNKKIAWIPRDAGVIRPWWQVDLGEAYEIDRIEIDARPDVDQIPTRRNFEILASNDPEFNTYTILGSQGATPYDHASTRVWLVDDDSQYRYVRIQKTVTEYFWLNEVRIINESMEFTPKYQFQRYTSVTNNYITRIGQLNQGVPGLHAYFTAECDFTHNEIWEVPYSAICAGWGWNNHLDMTACRDIRINYNKLHDAMLRCLDGGGIYTLGRQPNSTQIGNHTYDMPNPLGGFYTDTGTSYYTFRDNVIENTGMDYNTGGPTYSIANMVTHNFSNSAQAKLVNMSGTAKDGVTEDAIRFVPYNYPLEAIDIVANAGPTEAYWHLRDTIPPAAFERPEWSIFDNGINVSNHGSMNDDRFLNWYLKMHHTNAVDLLAMAKKEMEEGTSIYASDAINDLEDAIREAAETAAVRPIDRQLIAKSATRLRKSLMAMGKSRYLVPYEELYAEVNEVIQNTKVGQAISNVTQESYDALKAALKYSVADYNKLNEEQQRLATLKLEKEYAQFKEKRVSLDIKEFSFGDKQLNPSVIDRENKTINVHLLYSAGTNLIPETIKLSDQVKISPMPSANVDLTSPVVYTVSTLDGSASEQWTVVATRESITESEGEYTMNEALADTMGWSQVGTRSSHYKNKNFGDITYTFKMNVSKRVSGDWPSIVFRNQYSNKEFNDKGTSAYLICFSDGKLELHRFNGGVRTQFYGPVASVPQILGPSLDCPSFKYGEDNLIKLSVRNEAGGVRIILNINGTEALNVLDNEPGAITAPGYFGSVSPNTPVVLGNVQ
ncbi:MAG: discoidin domain-containing protein [Clostridia bacterium]|nr:discoidin domain-containing protein [Clostridia bacterium]